EIPDIRGMGSGHRHAGGRVVSSAVRGAAARPLRARQPGRVLRAAAPVLGGARRESSDAAHALERHAGGARAREHAVDQRRAVAGVAPTALTVPTVLVAGASGLVGFAAAKHFASLGGWKVIAVSRREPEGLDGVELISV